MVDLSQQVWFMYPKCEAEATTPPFPEKLPAR